MRGHETPCVLLAWRSRGDAEEIVAFVGEIKTRSRLRCKGFEMVSSAGFEPATPGLE